MMELLTFLTYTVFVFFMRVDARGFVQAGRQAGRQKKKESKLVWFFSLGSTWAQWFLN